MWQNDVYEGVYVDLFINGTVSECIFNTNLKHIWYTKKNLLKGTSKKCFAKSSIEL